MSWYLVTNSPDGAHAAARVRIGDKQLVIVDGKVGEAFDEIDQSSFQFSPDGSRYRYFAKNNGKWVTVVDGVTGPSYDNFVGFDFTADSKHIVYIGVRDDNSAPDSFRSWIVLDGKIGPETDLAHGEVCFSADSEHMAYSMRKDGKLVVVRDGETGQSYDSIFNLTYSPDGKHLIYMAEKEEKPLLVIDGIGIPGANLDPYICDYEFSPDNHQLACSWNSSSDTHDVRDIYVVDMESKVGTSLTIKRGAQLGARTNGNSRQFFNSDGKLRTFLFQSKEGLGNEATKATDVNYNNSFDSLYSADGKQFAAMVSQTGGEKVIVNGISDPVFDWVSNLAFSPDGSRVAYFAQKGEERMLIVDGKVISRNVDGRFVFGADGKRIAYVAEEKSSADDVNRKAWVVIDGVRGPIFDEIVAGPVVRKDGCLEYLAHKKEPNGRLQLLRVVVPGFSPSSEKGVIPRYSSSIIVG